MSRSPFAYPLVRNIDGDAGGAADLQTDIMRFMAILALCLMAIFALVQSIPLAPIVPVESPPAPVAAPQPVSEPAPQAAARPDPPPPPAELRRPEPATVAGPEPAAGQTVLTRPKWVSNFEPRTAEAAPVEPVVPEPPVAEPVVAEAPVAEPAAVDAAPSHAVQEQPQGFTLRFESDQALMRLVAQGKVGLYAIGGDRAQRMTISASRISFWDASTPNAFHEMETSTVPGPVVDALQRAGNSGGDVAWGVTLPGQLSGQLDALMHEHSGGALVIGLDGNLRVEAEQ